MEHGLCLALPSPPIALPRPQATLQWITSVQGTQSLRPSDLPQVAQQEHMYPLGAQHSPWPLPSHTQALSALCQPLFPQQYHLVPPHPRGPVRTLFPVAARSTASVGFCLIRYLLKVASDGITGDSMAMPVSEQVA